MKAVSVFIVLSVLSAAVAFSAHPAARERRSIGLPSISENEIEIDPRYNDISDHARTKKSTGEKKDVVEEVKETKEEKKDDKTTLEDVNKKEEAKPDEKERVRRGHNPLVISPMGMERSSGPFQDYYALGQEMIPVEYSQTDGELVETAEQNPEFTDRSHHKNKGYGGGYGGSYGGGYGGGYGGFHHAEAAIVPIVVKDPQVIQPVVQQPIVQTPVVQTPIVHQPIVHQPIIHQPIVHQPVVQQPIVHQPILHQPIVSTQTHFVHQPVHFVQPQPVHLVAPTVQTQVVSSHACPCYSYGRSDEAGNEAVQTPYIFGAPKTNYYRSNEMMTPGGLILSRAAYSDPECAPQNLIGLNLDKNLVEGFIGLEEMKLKKIEECSKKNGNSAEYIALMNNVKQEIDLLQTQVTALASKQKPNQHQ